MFSRKVKKEVSKLSLKQGDIIVLRTNKGFREWVKVLGKLVIQIKQDKGIDVTAIVLPEDIRFGSIGEKEMNNVGWFKQDAEEVKRILEENETLRKWNVSIKELHIKDTLKAYDIQKKLKEKIKKLEARKLYVNKKEVL